MLRLKNYRLLTGVLLLTAALALPRQAEAQGGPDTVYKKALPSTGFVVTTKPNNMLGYGTCWVVDAEKRLVITNQHVVSGVTTCKVAFPRFQNGDVVTRSGAYGKADYIPGKVLARDSKRDLALVQLDRLPAGTKTLVLAPQGIMPGADIWAIGNSGMAKKDLNAGTLWRVRHGKVKKVWFARTTLTGIEQKLEVCQVNTDSGSMPGDSGGPVVDGQGRLVAVNSTATDQDGDFGTDVTEVRAFLRNALGPKVQPSQTVVGSWVVTWSYKGQEHLAGLMLNSNGTGEWVGQKRFPGTFTFKDGKLTLRMPGSGVEATVVIVWRSNTQFVFTINYSDGATTYTATRR